MKGLSAPPAARRSASRRSPFLLRRVVRADHAHRRDFQAAAFRRRSKCGRRRGRSPCRAMPMRACTSTCCTAASSCCWDSPRPLGVGVPLGLVMGWSRRAEALAQPGVPAAAADPAARVDPARHRLARPGRRRQGADHLARRIRPVGDQQLRGRAQHRPDAARSGAHARHPRLDARARDPPSGRGADDLHRVAAVAAGVLDDAGGGRADWRDRRASATCSTRARSTSSRR